jgi:hypothetical protein
LKSNIELQNLTLKGEAGINLSLLKYSSIKEIQQILLNDHNFMNG